MIRSKLLLILLSGALIFASCSDSGTDPDDPDNGDEPIEPTASVNNPEDDATLEGEVTFSIDGESENGFSEARIFVGDEQVETVESPEMPYEQTITTYNYNNGNYELRAELDATDQDTTVDASVSTTFENYLVEIDTKGYLEVYLKNYDAYQLFISDPDGNVLRSVNLKDHTGDVVKLLPPSSFDNGAPESFAMTQIYNLTAGTSNNYNFLDTWAGLESWTTRLAGESIYSESPSSMKDVTVTMDNFDKSYTYGSLLSEKGLWEIFYPEENYQMTFEYDNNTQHLLWTLKPDHSSNPNTPVYKWENNVSNLSDSDELNYDVANDFTEMVSSTDISHPTGLILDQYIYDMSIAPDTWDEGHFRSRYFRGAGFDTKDSSTELGLYIPKQNHLYRPMIVFNDSNNEGVAHYQKTNKIPDEFKTVDAQINIANRSFDDVQFEASGSMDYIDLRAADYSRSNGYNYWYMFMPNDTESFVVPKIADSLDSSEFDDYNRDGFDLTYAYLEDNENLDDYGDYLDYLFGSEESEKGVVRYKRMFIGESQSKSIRDVGQVKQKQQLRNGSKRPPHLHHRKYRLFK